MAENNTEPLAAQTISVTLTAFLKLYQYAMELVYYLYSTS